MQLATLQDEQLWGASPSRPLPFRLARFLLLPALGAIALLAAACSSGGPSNSAATTANALVSQGLSAESSGQFQQALNDFTQAAAADPTAAIPYYDLGAVYQQLKETTKAANEYNKALLADPNYAPAMYNLAILQSSTNPLNAINLYDKLLQRNPNDSNVLFNLGLLLVANGQAAQGQTDLSKAILINPALQKRVPPGVMVSP